MSVSKISRGLQTLKRYVILKTEHIKAGDPFNVSPKLPSAAPAGATPGVEPIVSIAVEHADLTHDEVIEAAHDPNVAAIAPPMPVQLIEPLDFDPNIALPTAGNAWGVEAVGADACAETGAGAVVAILDTGIDASHAAFSGMNLVQKDFTGEGNGDNNGHGTHCAGTVFGRDVNGVRIGIARGVQNALIGKVLGESGGDTAGILDAIYWAVTNGANVISMSLGMDFPRYVQLLEQSGYPKPAAISLGLQGYRANVRMFEKLAELVRAQGLGLGRTCVIVAAAGNESRRELVNGYEIAVAPPATADGIVSVGALGQTGISTQPYSVASFSNTGPNVSAPGVAITSAKAGGGLVAMNGTSMATPHVAGVAALWCERMRVQGQPIVADQLIARLLGTARYLPNLDQLDVGAGMISSPPPTVFT
jgi:subtilisin family serine protease